MEVAEKLTNSYTSLPAPLVSTYLQQTDRDQFVSASERRPITTVYVFNEAFTSKEEKISTALPIEVIEVIDERGTARKTRRRECTEALTEEHRGRRNQCDSCL